MSPTSLRWRKSSFSGSQSDCVEVARTPGGDVLVRNSNHPGAGTIAVTPAEMAAWVAGGRAGQYDDLAG